MAPSRVFKLEGRPTRDVNGYMMISVEINGRPLELFIDTGSPVSVMPSHLAKFLDLTPDHRYAIPVAGIGGPSFTLGRTKTRLKIGNITRSISFHVIDHHDHFFIGHRDASRFRLVFDLCDGRVVQKPASISSVNLSPPTSEESFLQSLEAHPVFARSSTDVGHITFARHNIRTEPNVTPIALRPYRTSETKRKEIDRQVEDLLARQLIRPSDSPWAAPVTLAAKKDGSLRFCVDYRQLNQKTSSYRHPLPLIKDHIDRVGRSSIFTTLDAVSGYWHVALDEESIEKSAFITQSGHFEWLVMPFGLKNAPSTFQRIMQGLLKDFEGVEVYLDDIIVHTRTKEEHISLLSRVLAKLAENGIRLRRDKCHFLAKEIEYLGHVITNGSVKPSPKKLEAIQNFPTPRNIAGIQSFVGLANYYRDFVENMASLTAPLTKLTKKDVEFVWGTEQQNSFDEIKRRLTTDPVLAVYDPTLPCELTTDASKLGIASIFSQRHPDGRPKVVSYYSRHTTDAESRYTACELECLAVVESFDHFRIYFEGTEVSVKTDCSALRWLTSFKDTNSRLFRWSMRLSTYTYNVQHRSGKSNTAADALSRNPPTINVTAVNSVSLDTIAQKQNELEEYDLRTPATTINGVAHVNIRGRQRILVPRSLITAVLRSSHDDRNHPGTNITHQTISQRYWWPTIAKDVADYARSCITCQAVKHPNQPSLGLMQPTEVPTNPNGLWSIDTVVLGNAANSAAAKYAQVIVDHHSRYCWTFPTRTNTAEIVISSLSTLFECVGKPRVLISDNGKNFTSKRFENFLKSSHVEHRKTSAYHPQANGLNERTHFTIIRGISLAVKSSNSRLKWSALATRATADYNRNIHGVTGFPPVFLHFGTRSADTPFADVTLEDARRLAGERTERQQQLRKGKHDSRHRTSSYEIGDKVWHRIPSTHPEKNKLSPVFDGPYIITSKNGPESYTIQRPEDQKELPRAEVRAHASSLKTFFERPTRFLTEPTLNKISLPRR
jgi:hypothetical protein